jgi:fatty-acyl-CoA synthase
MGGRNLFGVEHPDMETIVGTAVNGPGVRALIGPPMMHGAAQWISFMMLGMGNTLVFASKVEKLDPDDFLSTIERHQVVTASIVGDAFARPILDQLEQKDYDLSSLAVIGSGGAPFSTRYKQAFIDKLPQLMIMDAIGSSETGAQATNPSSKAAGVSTGEFKPAPGAGVCNEAMDRVLSPGDDEIGWFTQTGRVPLGYLGDAAKTAKTFPVIEGTRCSVPGDRARYKADGSIEVLGRDSVTINSGGEKIFAEEVEAALKQHPDVFDTVVAGRESERWGQEVVAIVALREGANTPEAELIAEAAKHIARYKLPKAIVLRDEIVRSPSGKADYRWAKEQATSEPA